MAKAAAVEPGTTLVTETRQRVEPITKPSTGAHIDPWVYMEKLPADLWSKHIVYLYRLKDGKSDGPYIGCYSKAINHQDVFADYGGGHFRMILKNGAEIIAREEFEIEGAPKLRSDAPQHVPQHSAAAAGDTSNPQMLALLERLINKLEGQQGPMGQLAQQGFSELMRFQNEQYMTMLRQMQESLLKPTAAGAGTMDGIMEKVMNAMLLRLLEPKDPMAELQRVVEMGKMMGLVPASAVQSSGKGDWGTALVQMTPQILTTVQNVAASWATASQAQAARMRTITAPATPVPAAAAGVQPNPAPQPTPAAAPQNGDDQVLTAAAFIGICRIINNETDTIEQSASDAVDYLETIAPGILKQIVMAGDVAAANYILNMPDVMTRLSEGGKRRVPELVRGVIAEELRRQAAESAPQPPTQA